MNGHPATPAGTTRWIDRWGHRLHAVEQPGADPTIVLLHGFPDNHHLYDLLVPHLAGRHVVRFDFLGWGASDKPSDHAYTFAEQVRDLDTVIDALADDAVILVPHDASGPAALNWALDHRHRVHAIVALNTFYGISPTVAPNPPEAIRLFSDPAYARLSRHIARHPNVFRWLYEFQVGRFIHNDVVRTHFVPLLYQQFDMEPSTLEPFLQLNLDLTPSVLANTERHPELARLDVPVHTSPSATATNTSPSTTPTHSPSSCPTPGSTTSPAPGTSHNSTNPPQSPPASAVPLSRERSAGEAAPNAMLSQNGVLAGGPG
jgi:pimeloyl-ACP methyl ester carboxylesterase